MSLLKLLLKLILENFVFFNAIEVRLLLNSHVSLLTARVEVHLQLDGELTADDWRDMLQVEMQEFLRAGVFFVYEAKRN